MNSVSTLRIASNLAVRVLLRFLVEVRTAVIHPELLAVAKDRVVSARVPFPWRVGRQHHFARRRLLHDELRAAEEAVDQIVIHQRLPSRTDFRRLQRHLDLGQINRRFSLV